MIFEYNDEGRDESVRGWEIKEFPEKRIEKNIGYTQK